MSSRVRSGFLFPRIGHAWKLSAFPFFLLLSPLFAAPPLTNDQILKELDAIDTQHRDLRTNELNSALDTIDAAIGNTSAALQLYEKAVFTVRFDGEKGDQSAYAGWKKENEAAFRDPLFTKALTLQLQYLSLSIEATRGSDRSKLIGPLTDYLHALWEWNAAVNATANEGGKEIKNGKEVKAGPFPTHDAMEELLSKNIADTAVAKYLQIDGLLAALPEWQPVPSNDEGILESTIFPTLRKAKSPTLIPLWDEWIDHETALAYKSQLADQRSHFDLDELPTLRWKRAEDLVAVGQRDQGVQEMIEIIRSAPLHADNATWITELRGLLTGTPASPAK